MDDIETVLVNTEDAVFLHRLMNDKEILAVLNEVPTTVADWQAAVAEWKNDPDEEDYIIRIKNSPIGWMGINGLTSDDKTAFVKMIAILPEYQSRGIGEAVLKKLIARLTSRGFSSLCLLTDQTNRKARHCYEKCGFRVTDTLVQTMSNHAVVNRYKMKLFLDRT